MTRLAAAGVALAAIAICGRVAVGSAEAQTPPPSPAAPQGSVSGTVRNGTQGAAGVPGVRVQLLALGRDGGVVSAEAGVEDGSFSITAAASSSVTYVLRATYQGVSYLVEPPVLLSPEAPTDRRDITVYETTPDRPALRIGSTVVSVQGLDRARGQLTLQREDQVMNPTDRVYAGGPDRVSLRIPAPEGVIQMVNANTIDGESELDGGTATTTQPLKPGTNLVVTRYLVGYDRASDAYRMRVTTPLPAERMEIWVPDRFADDLIPGPGAAKRADRELQGERWRVVARTSLAAEGEGVVATIEGLSGGTAANPLTQFPGAAAGAALALAAVLGGVLLLGRIHLRWGEAAG